MNAGPTSPIAAREAEGLGQFDAPAAKGASGGGYGARHVAVIMDGNGRWAKRRHLPRAMGHRKGVEAVRALVRGLEPLGIDCLTLYAFSSENWKRPEDEISDLMGLMRRFIKSDLPEFIANDVRLRIIGDYKALDADIVEMLDDALARTAKGRRTLAVALNYGSQQEIARAAAKAAAQGEVTVESIAAHLDTADLPPLDLLVRTSGEVRLSNFLLWQAAYAEMWFTDVLWPDFTLAHLEEALESFAGRERRFGGR
ncbi:undecaprenyl diphosphate synthase [Altererythrobacter atlanticus]|uniref:Isoprenyl transferase n=2 Tax=Croceibacterium atlanticum TaxID=1267766 RepID=A0A0F7KRN9_9SPHN|nr:Ditrans,polycis-undecaprenyl-diphosphate synthase ((2E,6E)-farnesyl-diphosphate specific) [Croceibacterium atlanticum]MBB5733550.1 undecaprenyl diphosphate synthase [Croceibacterium atlanticum]